MAESNNLYTDLDEAGLPPAVLKAVSAQFAIMEKARAELAKLAAAHSTALRAAGKIEPNREIAFVMSRWGQAQVMERDIRGAAAKGGRYSIS